MQLKFPAHFIQTYHWPLVYYTVGVVKICLFICFLLFTTNQSFVAVIINLSYTYNNNSHCYIDNVGGKNKYIFKISKLYTTDFDSIQELTCTDIIDAVYIFLHVRPFLYRVPLYAQNLTSYQGRIRGHDSRTGTFVNDVFLARYFYY